MLKNWAMYRMTCAVFVFTFHCIFNIQKLMYRNWIGIPKLIDNCPQPSTLLLMSTFLQPLISEHPTIKCGIFLMVHIHMMMTSFNVQYQLRLHPNEKNSGFSSRVARSWKMFQFFFLYSTLTRIFTVHIRCMSNTSTKGIFKFKFSFRFSPVM